MFSFQNFPVLAIENISLREINVDQDFKHYFNYLTHPEVVKFISSDSIPKSPEEARNELEYWKHLFYSGASIYWAIEISGTPNIIGTIGYNYFNKSNKRAEISYDLNRNYWNQQIMTKSLRLITKFAFHRMDAIRLQATVMTQNARSIRLLEKLGFIKEGILNKYGIHDSVAYDYYMYSLTVSENNSFSR